jgi:hypothetical protein
MSAEHDRRHEGRSFESVLYGDMFIHSRAVETFARRGDLTGNQRSYLAGYDSNSLNSPNITGWEAVMQGQQAYCPIIPSPESETHVALITTARAVFEGIHWEQTRFLLGGEEGLRVAEPQAPITEEEFSSYFTHAQEQGLFQLPGQPTYKKFQPDALGIMIAYMHDGFVPGTLVTRTAEVQWDPRFREKLLAANVLKLGCYLAVSQQAAFENKANGEPISANFTIDESMSREFEGRTLPGIAEAYQQAHGIFSTLWQRDQNPIAAHLIPQSTLPYLID